MSVLSGWGRYPIADSALDRPDDIPQVRAAFAHGDGLIARGNGRSYGDAAIGATRTVMTTGMDRFRRFDAESGRVTVEAGLLLADLIAVLLPRGFFPVVVPGTRFVTVGGAIAADVHGKNHHRDGGFGDHVDSLMLMTAEGDLINASREENAALFAATVGGMGLTGTIVEATLRLHRVETGWIRQRTVVAPDLAAAMAALDAAGDAHYSVAWIDCVARGAGLGRALVYLGEHARRAELDEHKASVPFPGMGTPRLSVPIDLPSFTLNRVSVGLFNALRFHAGARSAGETPLIPAGPYFFPLDGISQWNRIYGRDGFLQHQCVLPAATAADVLAEMLQRIAARGTASFLAVLKKLGPGHGLLSFPLPGYTLALDFPVSQATLAFLDDLDRLVVAAGGRLYLAKDARQSRATFEAGYPALAQFRDIRRTVDPGARLRSRLSERLGI